MRVELFHDSKYGNGARVADEFKRLMAAKGNDVNVHRIDELSPKDVAFADLYVFGSPTHMGRATRGMVRFVKKVNPPSGAKYAVFATCSAAMPDKKTGMTPSEEELNEKRRTIPIIDELLREKGLMKVAEMVFFVHPETMRGPLIDGWQAQVESFIAQIHCSY